jgi:L-rhamnose isomerase
MTKNYQKAYDILAEQLTEQGINVNSVLEALKKQHIETPSWGTPTAVRALKLLPGPAPRLQPVKSLPMQPWCTR